jgi:hypothetical protein
MSTGPVPVTSYAILCSIGEIGLQSSSVAAIQRFVPAALTRYTTLRHHLRQATRRVHGDAHRAAHRIAVLSDEACEDFRLGQDRNRHSAKRGDGFPNFTTSTIE